MKFSKNLTALLKNYNTINQGIQFREGTRLRTISNFGEIIADADLHDEDFIEKTFAIFSLPQFLSTLALFESPDLTFKETFFEIQEGQQRVKYSYANPQTIVSPAADKEFAVNPDNVQASFNISCVQLEQLLKAAGIMRLEKLGISKNGVRIFNKNAGDNADSDQFLINIDVDTSSDKEFIINVDNLKIIPSDYTVQVEVRPNGVGFIEMQTTSLPCAKSLRYIIALSINS